MLNLGTNAAQSIEEKGINLGDYIRLKAEEHTIRETEITGLPEAEYIKISFEDSGKGMSKEVLKRAFDPLFSTRGKSSRKGQGLGLAMVYNIITRKHDGFIDIESTEGEGTAVLISYPRLL